jgi:invasion protein IalB
MSHAKKWLLLLVVAILLPVHTSQAAQQFTRSQAYGNWMLRCAKDDNPKVKSKEKCSLLQNMMTEKGERLLSVNMVSVGKKKAKVAVFTLPLGFYIPDGVQLAVDKGKTRNLAVAFCTQAGCIAQLKMDRKLIKELIDGGKMKLSMVTGNRLKKLEFAISLKGITAGLNAVK